MNVLPTTQVLGKAVAQRHVNEFFITDNVYSGDEVLEPHAHERAFVSVCVGGAYDERIGSRTFERRPSTAAFHHPHAIEAARMGSRGARVLSIEVGRYGQMLRSASHVNLDHAGPLLPRLLVEMQRSDAAAPLVIEACALEIIAAMTRTQGVAANDRIGGVLGVLHDRFAEPLTIAELAQIAGVHPVHLAREFRKRTGQTIGQYVRELRIRRASDELRTTRLPIAEIALRAGFADQSHLGRWIKRYTGVSPATLRRSQKLKAF